MEEKYWEMREAMERAKDIWCGEPTRKNRKLYEEAKAEYIEFCTVMLEHLMDENSDILRRLKMI